MGSMTAPILLSTALSLLDEQQTLVQIRKLFKQSFTSKRVTDHVMLVTVLL